MKRLSLRPSLFILNMSESIHPLLRQLQIAVITDTSHPIIDWFNAICMDMYALEANVYHQDGGEIIYYHQYPGNIKRIMFFRNDDRDVFWCDFERYWNIIQVEFGITYSVAQDITKILLDSSLGSDVLPGKPFQRVRASDALRLSVLNPQKVYLQLQNKITTALHKK